MTCCCLSVIDKSCDHRHLNVKLGCFSSYQDNCLIRICWMRSHTKKPQTNPKGLRCSWITASFLLCLFLRRYRSYPNPPVLPMQITCHWVDIHSPAQLWLDMKLACCLHQLWLRGLSSLCSDVVWEWKRYSNKAIWVNWFESNILYQGSSMHYHPAFPLQRAPYMHHIELQPWSKPGNDLSVYVINT